jgi:hypothetical protein
MPPHIYCQSCSSPLVQVTQWIRQDEAGWLVSFSCPECGLERSSLIDQQQAELLSFAVEEGFAVLLEALSEFCTPRSPAEADLVMRLQLEALSRRQ